MSKWKAARFSALLSLLFLVVYGATNWFTSLRGDVDIVAFAWERHIPFVPWMIVPYMSIDLFFIAAPFVCRTDNELRLMSKRITFAIIVAGICFLLFPFRFAFERPSANGWLGIIFDQFRTMDQPHNLLPSLHITLRTILAAVYLKHAGGVWRVLCHVWFSLIGFSTVLTYQHHLLDRQRWSRSAPPCPSFNCDSSGSTPRVSGICPDAAPVGATNDEPLTTDDSTRCTLANPAFSPVTSRCAWYWHR